MSESLSLKKSLDSVIYKVKRIVNGSLNTIYVFNAKKEEAKLVEPSEKELFKEIFSDREAEQIQSGIKVVFSDQKIHSDDSIGTIKIKIINEFKSEISLDEIYLYCQKMETLNAVSVYQSLTQNGKLQLTKVRLDQFISNIVCDENGKLFEKPTEKEVYTFDDLFEMKFDNKKYVVNKVLGQKFFIVENEYPFVCDPYDVEEFDKFFERSARKSLTTLNNHLLLSSGDIVDADNLEQGNKNVKTIYLCLAEDVLEYLNKKDVSEETVLNVYYPFLHNKNINDLESLVSSREKLVEGNNKFLNEKTLNSFNTINMFYDVFYERKSELNYINKGIKFIKAVIRPEFNVKIPLEIIFKIVHATQKSPLIKYNPSSRQENVYRLFTDKIATDGRKIPYLKKATIFKLMKSVARNKSVAVYIESSSEDNSQTMICEFDEEGYITVSSEFKTVVNVEEIDTIFQESINPIIQEIKNLLEQSGYKLNKFGSLNDENVEIKQLNYEMQIKITKPLDIQAYRGCISSIFINETNAFKGKGTTINLRFKRVSNYSKFNSQEAFILEKSEQGLRGDQIIEALLENFPEELDRNQAVEMVRKVANELEIERGARKSDIKIKNNPGFKTTISLQQETGIITILTENINNINYLYTIPIYLDTIVRLTQDKSSTRYPVKEINKLCSESSEDVSIEDIVSSAEESADLSEVPSIEPEEEEVQYNKFKTVEADKPKGALSLFFDEGDEDSLESFDGGQVSDSSEESIPSEKSSSEELEKSLPSMPSESEESEKSLPSIASEKSEESEKSLPSIASEKSEESEKSLPSEASSLEKTEQKEIPEEKPVTPESKSEENEIPILSPESKSEEKSVTPESKSEEKEIPILSPQVSEEKKTSSEEFVLPQKKSTIIESEESEKEESEKEESEKEKSEKEEESIKSKKTSSSKTKGDSSKTKGITKSKTTSSKSDVESDSEEEVRNIDGMKLNKPYYFQTLIEKRDPILILKEDTARYNSYPRTCSSNMRRQPVILSDAQLDKIKKEHPGFLRDEDVIKYGSKKDQKDQFNYICPRYWCLKNNTIIDPKDLKEVKGKDGKKELVHPTCGKVLPKGEKSVKPGYYIYEFYEPKPGKKDYKKFPGLIPDSHPDGLCLPCCFDKYNTEGRIKANEKCYKGKKEEVNQEKAEKKEQKAALQEEDEYIKGPDKFPLDPGRWGYLPVEMQTILHEVNADCQMSKTNTNLKDDHPCLLRHGIEINNKQSFVACISDALFFGKEVIDESGQKRNAKILSLSEMRERITKAITVDTFIKYQNGNLVTDFHNMDVNVNIDKYKGSKLYSKIDINKEADKAYFTKVISAFENFIAYLGDNDAFIDHTYLWDIVSMPNKYLFPTGVNLVIFDLPKDDITNNVQLICPSNHYSTEFYQARKPTIIMMRENNYYEPIYTYTTSKKAINIATKFKEYDRNLSKTMRAVFKEIIKPFFDLICRPLSSMPTVYKAKRPLLLYDLIQKLDKYEYEVKKLVLNFNSKVIGVVAKEPVPSDRTGFIPCYPSALDEELKKDLDFVFMTDLTLWNNYITTVQFLNNLTSRSKKRRDEPDIPCKPAFKVIEDEHVVGILTNTNQFVQLSKPIRPDEIDSELDLPSFNNNNYIVDIKAKPMINTEIEFTTKQEVDEVRVDYIKKIRLETNFYNVFRNTIRILLNDYENAKTRTSIENEISKEYIIYSEKLINMITLLESLVKDKMQFTGDKNYYKLIDNVSTCIVKDKDSCEQASQLCAVTENGKCKLILPKNNLITEKLNKPIYFARMADEMIRYSRIKSFMFEPQTYLSFGSIGYNLRDNEIILIQSLLTQEYFEMLTPAITNKYIKYNSYDEAQPVMTQVYENTIPSLDQAIGRKNQVICDKIIKDHIISSTWKHCFPESYGEIEYSKYNYCTFNFIIDLIERKTKEHLSINQIKNELFNEYKNYIQENVNKIVNILIREGKKTLGDQVLAGTLTLSNLIYTDNYFLTTFDLWLLVTKYKIPTIFVCQNTILQTNFKKNAFLGYGDEGDDFAFVIIPGFRPENVPGYKLIQSETGDVFISLNNLKEEGVEKIETAFRNRKSIEQYLEEYEIPKLTVYETKKPKLVIEGEKDVEKPKPKKKPVPLKIESSTPISPEEYILKPKRKRSQKKIIIKGNKQNKTKKKPPLIIEKSSSSKSN